MHDHQHGQEHPQVVHEEQAGAGGRAGRRRDRAGRAAAGAVAFMLQNPPHAGQPAQQSGQQVAERHGHGRDQQELQGEVQRRCR